MTGFSFLEIQRRYYVYPDTLKLEEVIEKYIFLQKEVDAMMNYKDTEKILLKSVGILREEITNLSNDMPWPPQPGHLTVESFQIPPKLDYFFERLLSGKNTTNDSPHVARLKLSFSQDVIYAVTHGKVKTPKSILYPYAIKSLTNNTETYQYYP